MLFMMVVFAAPSISEIAAYPASLFEFTSIVLFTIVFPVEGSAPLI
jgi:hypothetical protein